MSHADRNLLFGILAVQMNFVGRDALIAAMHAWVLERSKPLGRILVEQQALSPSRQSPPGATGRRAPGGSRRRCREKPGRRGWSRADP